MEQIYHIGECPMCRGYGRMELIYNFLSGKISAICEECDLEFDSISDYKNNANGYRDYCYNAITAPLARLATLEEIECSEWYPFVVDK